MPDVNDYTPIFIDRVAEDDRFYVGESVRAVKIYGDRFADAVVHIINGPYMLFPPIRVTGKANPRLVYYEIEPVFSMYVEDQMWLLDSGVHRLFLPRKSFRLTTSSMLVRSLRERGVLDGA